MFLVEAGELRKQLFLLEQELARLHERLLSLLYFMVEALEEADARLKAVEESNISKLITFEAEKLGVSEEQLLRMAAEFVRKRIEEGQL
jgi:hypothetical protein